MYTKRALIRAEDGKTFYVQCECGQKPVIDDFRNECTCGIIYDGAGWIKERPQAEEVKNR